MKFKKLAAGVTSLLIMASAMPMQNNLLFISNTAITANAETEGVVEGFASTAYSMKESTMETSVMMNGRTYYNAVSMNGYLGEERCTSSFNVEDIDELSFTVGHVDNKDTYNATLAIYLDDKLYDSIDLTSSMKLTEITIDVSKNSVVRFNLGTGAYNHGVYALADFKADGVASKKYLTPQYEDVDGFLSSMFTYSETAARTSDDNRNAFNMNGRTYYNGIIMNGYLGSEKCTSSFNVENIDELSFTVGHVDNESNHNATLSIYLDDKFYDSIDLTGTMKLTKITLDVAKNSVVRFNLGTDAYDHGVYGLADFKFDGNISKKYLTPDYEDVDTFLGSMFTYSETSARTSDDKRNAFNLNGRTYYNGLVMNGYLGAERCTSSFNVENIDELSFTVGHVDNEGAYNATLTIYLDDKFYDSVDLTGTMNLTNITLDVSNKSVVRFNLGTDAYDHGVYGLADFKFDGNTSKKYLTPDYEDVDTFLSSMFTYSETSARTSEDKRNAFNMNGRTYYNGLVMNGYLGAERCTSSFNVENIDELSFTVGHVDNEGGYNATLTIYLDDKFYDSIDLTGTMNLTKITLDVSKNSVIRFNLGIGAYDHGVYGLADFTFDGNTSKKYLTPQYEDVDTFLSSMFTYSETSARTSEDKRNAFKMNGKTYSNGLVMNGYLGAERCTSSFNVENIDSVSFKVGHVDENDGAAATLEIYLDDKLYKTVDLSETMTAKDIVIDLRNASVLRFNLGTGAYSHGIYGIADITFGAASDDNNDFILGDVDGDGIISAMDASAALTYYVMNPENIEDLGFAFDFKAADWDGNGIINAIDASAILTYYVSNN